MRIWVTRHGQTDLNKEELMQGLTDCPLNETGIAQAKAARESIGDIHFDAVYASPLDRAIVTASIIGGVDRSQVIVDPRIIEADFGKYEKMKYSRLGLKMTLYWMLPEIFPRPDTVESIQSMVERSHSFLKELEEEDAKLTEAEKSDAEKTDAEKSDAEKTDADERNILVVCHGGIIRAICGYLEDRKLGIKWRPKPQNCEIRVYECRDGQHRPVELK